MKLPQEATGSTREPLEASGRAREPQEVATFTRQTLEAATFIGQALEAFNPQEKQEPLEKTKGPGQAPPLQTEETAKDFR